MKRVAAVFAVLGLAAAPTAVLAQGEHLEDLTSYEPLVTVIDGYAAGDEISGFVQTNAASDAPIASSLQFMVNLSWNSAFLEVDAIPHGLTGNGGELESLESWFDGNMTSLPPLHPWGTANGVADVRSLFSDWTAYGNQGPIDGPVEIVEPPTVVWTIELSEPFDETCSAARSVGRAWNMPAITGPEGTLTEDLLEQEFAGDSHAALANGENTRFIELRCSEGGKPSVQAGRVNPDLGRIRPFGPINVVALVKGAHVVFFITERTLGLDNVPIDPFFYANEPGGVVVPFEPVAEVPALVPNVYDTYSSRITITMDIPEGEEAFHGGDTAGETLLFRPGDQQIVMTGTGGCVPPTGAEYAADFVDDLIGGLAEAGLWSRDASWALVFATGSDWGSWEGTTPDGREFTITIDEGGNVTVRTGECEGTGTASGAPFGTDPDPSDVDIVAGGEDGSDSADSNVEPVFSDDSGVPWGLIGAALVLLAGVGIVVGRSRTTTKDCKPEEEAWDAAIRAFDEAKRTHEHWQGEAEHWSSLYSEQQTAIDNRYDEPNRELGYLPTPEGEAAYERDLAAWQDREAAAGDAMEVVDAFREKAEVAKRNLEEAAAAKQTAADLVWQAQIALQNCRGSAPALPEGVGTGTGGSGGPHPGPTTPPPSGGTQQTCAPGTTRRVETTSHTFTVAAAVNLRLPTAAWGAFAPNGVASAKALYEMSEDDAYELVRDLERRADQLVRPNASITLKTITVTCFRVEQCTVDGEWVDTGETEAHEGVTDSGTVNVPISTELDSVGLSGYLCGEADAVTSTERGEEVERGKLRAALRPYMEAEEEYQGFSCT